MSSTLHRRLIDHLAHDSYTPRRLAELVEDLGLSDRAELATAVEELKGRGEIQVDDAGLISLPSIASLGAEWEGVFTKNPRGFGFVRPSKLMREGSVFIPPDETLDALSGDVVRVEVRRNKARERHTPGEGPQFEGRIIEVVKRKRATFTGRIERRGGQWIAFPDAREIRNPIVVRDAESKNVQPGDKVVLDMVVYPEGDMLGEGVITRILGEAGRPDVETQAVIAAYGLSGEFPEECVEQARAITAGFEDSIAEFKRRGASALPGRTDKTDEFIITIDPPDAKDYDDAISIRRTERGWDLSVYIADVGEFIAPDTALDVEARRRGNSVYLPRHVIPMLPEVLSNGICSLQEGVPRFCKAAFMSYDERGEIRREGVGSVIINSRKRLTYLEAQALIDGDPNEAKKHARTEPNYSDELIGVLREMNALAKAIRARRERQGMISLELPEVVLLYDEQGHVIDAEREDDAFTHTLIEMFMVEANEVLARLFDQLDVPLIRRIHPEPTPGDVDELRKAAKVAGFTIPARPSREELQGLLNATRGTPAARAVHMAVLRTLTKAEYSPARIGHFALASGAYAHFTSPIRRYADLTVHRALVEYLRLTDNGQRRPRTDDERNRLGRKLLESDLCPPEPVLHLIARDITRTEQNAEEAERNLKQFLVLQLLEKHIGEVFRGVVTGVSQRGVFVQIDKYLADGMVKTADLPGDITRSQMPPQWKIDPRTGALVDQRSGRSFNMGDTVSVGIANVDLARRQLDLVIVNAEARAVGKSKEVKPRALGPAGGIGGGKGAGFGAMNKLTGTQRRSQKSKSRDKGKKHHRRDT